MTAVSQSTELPSRRSQSTKEIDWAFLLAVPLSPPPPPSLCSHFRSRHLLHTATPSATPNLNSVLHPNHHLKPLRILQPWSRAAGEMEMPVGPLDGLANELLLIVTGYIKDFDEPGDQMRALAALARTNRRMYPLFNDQLYKADAATQRKAMAWGAFFGNLATMEKSRAAGVSVGKAAEHTMPTAVKRALGWCGPQDTSPLILAVSGGHNAAIDWLVQRDASLLGDEWSNSLDNDGLGVFDRLQYKSMYWAIHYNQGHTVRHLLDQYSVLEVCNEQLLEAIHVAVALGRDAMFDSFLSLPGCGLEALDRQGNTPLHYAARGFFDVDISVKPRDYIAKADIIEDLVRRGADMGATNDDGQSPIVFAMASDPRQWRAALQLLDLQPPTFLPDDDLIPTVVGYTQMDDSEMTKHELKTILRRLLTPDTINGVFKYELMSLFAPTITPDYRWFNSSIRWFRDLETGPLTLLTWSIMGEHGNYGSDTSEGYWCPDKDLPLVLLNLGARPGQGDSEARTPLHACVFRAMAGVGWEMYDEWPRETRYPYTLIRELLERGASLDARDSEGLTPLDYVVLMQKAAADRVSGDYVEDYVDAIEACARSVVRIILSMAWDAAMCPSEANKRRMVDKLGVDILALLDPLRAELE
ncbi:hypothetical protein QBC39DRAFT_434470 [Podospora conica]|nr:hypothetical protein QBC39DRAFT_434470 [Schizothecium conicum]